jgi:DNA polymerase I
MKIVDTDKVLPGLLKGIEKDWVYNGLDCCVTYEVLEALLPQLNTNTSRTYDFSRALQGPVLEMRLRGVKIDEKRRAEVREEFSDLIDAAEARLERIVREGCNFVGFNWRATADLRKLFYDIFKIPVSGKTKTGTPSVNRDALEKMESYSIARIVIDYMTHMRELKKDLDVIKTEIDPDGRARTSYNIAGTTTGRFSSSISEFGTGGNQQNIKESLRSIFIADPGMKMANFDAEQGESRVVGAIEWNLFKIGTYLDACERGDLHTDVARLCWPELRWTNNLEGDRKLAELPYYRDYSRRFMCKKLGHGSNYGGKPATLSASTKTDITVIVEFQQKYFKAFPAHVMWQNYIGEQVRVHGKLVSLMGRERHFFGRRDDEKVIRDAIAFDPQGSLVDIVNRGMLNVYRSNDCQILIQGHDSILVQYPEEREDEIVPKILGQLNHPVPLKHGRTLVIPYGCKTGWNWGIASEANPDGLQSYKPNDKRRRTPQV